MSTTKKLLPENIQIPTPMHRASATGLMGFANTLPECPSRLPDGTILDYSAVDETWTDVDFPEREVKPQTVAESRKALEESFFRDYRESNQSQATPAHLLKHMTRVQAMGAMTAPKAKTEPVVVTKFAKVEGVPLKLQKWQSKQTEDQEAIKDQELFAETINSVKSVLEGNDLVVEAETLESFVAGLEEVLETYELSKADYAQIQEFIGSVIGAAKKAVGAVGNAVKKTGAAVGNAMGAEADEASPEAKANKSKRRSAELGQKLAYNKAQASTAGKKDPLNPTGAPRLSATLKPAAKPFVKWATKSASAQ